jgi:hypothetical protein
MRLSVVLVGVLFILGCISSAEKEDEVLSERPELAECNGRQTREEREGCYIDVALSMSNAGICEEISSDAKRNLCFHRLAVKVGDINMCNRIRNDDWRYNNCLGSATL